MKFNQYLQVPYVDGGRDPSGWDCWGKVRWIAHHDFAYPLFESFGHVHPDDKQSLHNSFEQIQYQFDPCQPKAGAIACLFRRGVLVHVGICVEVDGLLQVIHTSRQYGAEIIKRRDFERLALVTKYYAYRDK